jgi:hypothetical protein
MLPFFSGPEDVDNDIARSLTRSHNSPVLSRSEYITYYLYYLIVVAHFTMMYRC